MWSLNRWTKKETYNDSHAQPSHQPLPLFVLTQRKQDSNKGFLFSCSFSSSSSSSSFPLHLSRPCLCSFFFSLLSFFCNKQQEIDFTRHSPLYKEAKTEKRERERELTKMSVRKSPRPVLSSSSSSFPQQKSKEKERMNFSVSLNHRSEDILKAFTLFDRDSDGRIDLREFRSACLALGVQTNDYTVSTDRHSYISIFLLIVFSSFSCLKTIFVSPREIKDRTRID